MDRTGETGDPWGTPMSRGWISEVSPLSLMNAFLSERKELTQAVTCGGKLSRWITCVVYIVKEAFDVKHECRGFEAFLLGGFNIMGKGDPGVRT